MSNRKYAKCILNLKNIQLHLKTLYLYKMSNNTKSLKDHKDSQHFINNRNI